MSKGASGRAAQTSWLGAMVVPTVVQLFKIYHSAGVKFSPTLLKELAVNILLAVDLPFNPQFLDPKDNVLLTQKITATWITHFMDAHSIVLLEQRGRLTCSPKKEAQIEMSATYHLGVLHRGF